MPSHRAETRFWRVDPLDGLELVHGTYCVHAFPRHAHERHVIAVMISGCEQLLCRGGRHLVPAGSIVLLNPGVWHENRGDGCFEYRTFYLPRSLLNRVAGGLVPADDDNSLFGTPVVRHDLDMARRLAELHIALESGRDGLAFEEALAIALSQVLAWRAPAAIDARHEPTLVRRIRDYLASNVTERVSLADLSSLVGRNPYHVLRTFKRITGATPHQFQTQIRIQRAMTLLRSGSPIAEAAIRLGFSDQSHFTRAFTRSLGVSPGRFVAASRSCKTDRRPRG